MNRKQQIAGWIYTCTMGILFLCCFVSQSIYEVTTKYASLATFLLLGLMLLCYVNPIKALQERELEFYLMIAGCVIALINLFLIGSHKGAFLTAANLMMMCYLVPKTIFSKAQKLVISGIGSAFLFWWYGNVKWNYNFNMVGLFYMISCILALLFLEWAKKEWDLSYLKYISILLYITATLYCLLYHSRGAMAGLLIMGGLFLFYRPIVKSKTVGILLVLLSTLGSLIFTLAYIWLGKSNIQITFLYKDILSGRQDIWQELWEAFLKQPLTGIGSSYQLKSFFIFEVHHGLLDILVVHGIIVFLIALILLIKRLVLFVRECGNDMTHRISFAGVFAILFTSWFENFFIVSPYLLVLFFLLTCTHKGDLV